MNYHFVIEDFILSDNNFDNKNIESIYNILNFATDIEDFQYSHITQILLNSNVIKNDYQEFFKLSIFDLFIYKKAEVDRYFEILVSGYSRDLS